jgi:hypothetical protein
MKHLTLKRTASGQTETFQIYQGLNVAAMRWNEWLAAVFLSYAMALAD